MIFPFIKFWKFLLFEHFIPWNLLFHGNFCSMETFVPWNLLFHGILNSMESFIQNLLFHFTHRAQARANMEFLIPWPMEFKIPRPI